MNNKHSVKVKCHNKHKIEDKTDKADLKRDEFINKLIDKNKYYDNVNIFLDKYEEVFKVGDAVSDGIYLSDGNGIVLAVNKSYSDITGIKAEEVVGSSMQAVLEEKYEKGEYLFYDCDKLNNSVRNTATNSDTFYTEKPRAICAMVLEQKRIVSVAGTLSFNGQDKKVSFVGKPYFDDQGQINMIIVIIREITELVKLKTKLEEVEKKSKKYLDELLYLRSKQVKSDLLGRDPSIERIKQMIIHIAKSDATVLITGETGVGKEVVAREVYKNSNRSKGPYIKVNCAAIPDNLLESELFGYEKGAFTGALKKEKLGYFELANGGTILLDEIGEMPVNLQSKLLRVLQEREVTRIGGTKSIKLDVRVIACTNQDLEEQIKIGTFRSDLYYRLNVLPIKIPPLRERKSDITLLAYRFLERFNEKYGKNKEFENSAVEVLESYEWPGNVRELENNIERLVLVGDENLITERDVISVIGKDKFQNDVVYNEDMTLKDAVDMLERSIIEKVLRKYKSSYKAAKVLGVTQPTVLRKAKALGIDEW